MTARAERPWFRVYTEITRDRKLRREKPETRWLWIVLMAMAGSSPERGALFVGSSPARVEDIADEAALPVAKVRVGLAAFEAAGMISINGDGAWHLRNWNDRQYESDCSTDRVRAFRQRQRNVSRNGSEAPPESETDPDLDLRVTHSEPGCGQPVDDEELRIEEQPLDPAAVKARAVLDRATDAKTAGIAPRSPGPYRARVFENLNLERGDELLGVIATHPDAPVDVLTGWLLGQPNHLADYRKAE